MGKIYDLMDDEHRKGFDMVKPALEALREDITTAIERYIDKMEDGNVPTNAGISGMLTAISTTTHAGIVTAAATLGVAPSMITRKMNQLLTAKADGTMMEDIDAVRSGELTLDEGMKRFASRMNADKPERKFGGSGGFSDRMMGSFKARRYGKKEPMIDMHLVDPGEDGQNEEAVNG